MGRKVASKGLSCIWEENFCIDLHILLVPVMNFEINKMWGQFLNVKIINQNPFVFQNKQMLENLEKYRVHVCHVYYCIHLNVYFLLTQTPDTLFFQPVFILNCVLKTSKLFFTCHRPCAISQKTSPSWGVFLSFNGPQKWIHSLFFFFLSNRINKQYVSMQLLLCKHQYVTRHQSLSLWRICRARRSDGSVG